MNNTGLHSLASERKSRVGRVIWTKCPLDGWKNSEMVRRYAHLNADHLLGVSSKLDTFLPRFDLKKAVS